MVKAQLILDSFNQHKKMIGAGLLAGASLVAGVVANKKNEQKTENEVMDYMQYNPATLSAKSFVFSNTTNEEGESVSEFLERMKVGREILTDDDSISDYDFSNFSGVDAILIEDKEGLNDALKGLESPRVKRVARNLYKNGELYSTTVTLLQEMEQNAKFIRDKKVLSMINKMYDNLAQVELDQENVSDAWRELKELDTIINAYNNINENYVTYRKLDYNGFYGTTYEQADTQEFLNYFEDDELEENLLKKHLKAQIFEGKDLRLALVDDFITAQKTENFEQLGRGEAKDYLYNVYLKKTGMPKSVVESCKKIKNDYNVMVLPNPKSQTLKEQLEFIENELAAWREVGGEQVRFPGVLNLNSTNIDFMDGTVGQSKPLMDQIQLKSGNPRLLREILRHEIMHLNDKLIFKFNIGEDNVEFLKEIMPTKVVKGKIVRDYKNCKYKEEFLNAGVDPQHIDYAYKQRAEFIAVASEGDMSKYSPEFKDVLIRLGMPEYMFDIKVINPTIERRARVMEIIRNDNPEVKDYDQLVILQERHNRNIAKNMEKLFSKIFGEK